MYKRIARCQPVVRGQPVSRSLGHGLLLAVALLACDVVAAEPQTAPQLRDPTAPPQTLVRGVSIAKPAVALTLESVLIGSQRRVAVINGKPMSEGDQRAGLQVIAIQHDGVLIEHAGKRSRLTLPEIPSVRQQTVSRSDNQ